MIIIKAAVCGFGSIGQRHANNLRSLGHDVIVYDVVDSALQKAEQEKYIVCRSIQEAIDKQPDIFLICSPTSYHISIAQTVLTGNNTNLKGLFIEKPISYSLDGTKTILDLCKENNIVLGCSCNLRYLSGIKLVKTLLDNEAIGKPISCEYYFGYWLPSWHNDDTWKSSYSASETGGILNDDSHSINLIEYLFGDIIESKCFTVHTDLLNIKNEDVTKHIHLTDKNIICGITSDYINHVYRRTLSIVGEKGNIELDIEKLDNDMLGVSVYLHTASNKEWRVFSCNQKTNDMYIDMVLDYITCVMNGTPFQCNGLSEIRIIDKLKKSEVH